MEKPTNQIRIENLSKKRYKYFAQDEMSKTDQDTVDVLADEILDCIKRWRNSLHFEFIIEELTKLGWAPCLLYDDDGNFAISGDGMEPLNQHTYADTVLTHFIKYNAWQPTIRKALDYYLDNE